MPIIFCFFSLLAFFFSLNLCASFFLNGFPTDLIQIIPSAFDWKVYYTTSKLASDVGQSLGVLLSFCALGFSTALLIIIIAAIIQNDVEHSPGIETVGVAYIVCLCILTFGFHIAQDLPDAIRDLPRGLLDSFLFALCASFLIVATVIFVAKETVQKEHRHQMQTGILLASPIVIVIYACSLLSLPAAPSPRRILLVTRAAIEITQTQGMELATNAAIEAKRLHNLMDTPNPEGTSEAPTATGTPLPLNSSPASTGLNGILRMPEWQGIGAIITIMGIFASGLKRLLEKEGEATE